jgi:uncharacterized protein YegP (UPF0339 family)
MRPYFKIVRRSGGYGAQYWSGGNLVWWTETYVHKAGAVAAIESLRLSAATAPLVDEAKAA